MLRKLDLVENSINDEGFMNIVNGIITLPAFENICVKGNLITEEGYKYFIKEDVRFCKSIKVDESIY